MITPNAQLKATILKCLTATFIALSLASCGGGTDVPQSSGELYGQLLPESDIGANNQLQEDPGTTPVVTQITAATGVQIQFADEDQQQRLGSEYIETQWVNMQTCLQITALTPKVLVLSERISPLSETDDVLRFIDGSITATATVDDSSATIQVTEADFDGSIGVKGNYLRSIMGRYLWFSAGLPERDYPYDCANQSG